MTEPPRLPGKKPESGEVARSATSPDSASNVLSSVIQLHVRPVHLHLDLARRASAGRGWSSSSRARSSRCVSASMRLSALSKSFWLTTAMPPVCSAMHAQAVLRLAHVVAPLARVDLSRRGPARRPGRAGRSCRTSRWRGWPRASARRARAPGRRRRTAAPCFDCCELIAAGSILAGVWLKSAAVASGPRPRRAFCERVEVVAVAHVDDRLAAVVHLLEVLQQVVAPSRTRRARGTALRSGPRRPPAPG